MVIKAEVTRVAVVEIEVPEEMAKHLVVRDGMPIADDELMDWLSDQVDASGPPPENYQWAGTTYLDEDGLSIGEVG